MPSLLSLLLLLLLLRPSLAVVIDKELILLLCYFQRLVVRWMVNWLKFMMIPRPLLFFWLHWTLMCVCVCVWCLFSRGSFRVVCVCNSIGAESFSQDPFSLSLFAFPFTTHSFHNFQLKALKCQSFRAHNYPSHSRAFYAVLGWLVVWWVGGFLYELEQQQLQPFWSWLSTK